MNLIRRELVLMLGTLGILCVAGPAAASTGCETRGSTLLESRGVRLFEAAGHDYACLRPSGTIRRLGLTAAASTYSSFEIAGQYVAWTEPGQIEGSDIGVLNVGRGTRRNAGASGGAHHAITDYVLSPRGTIVYLLYYDALCTDSDWVYESPLRGRTTQLDHATAFGESGNHCSVRNPLTTLGLSQDGSWAYWRNFGHLKGAAL